MGVQESIGTTISISAAVPATYDAAGYGALTFTEIGEITEVPSFGGEASTVEHTPLKTGITEKFHGAINYGSMTVPLGLDISDAGQVIVNAEFVSKTRSAFKITWPDGAITYQSGKCMSEVRRGASTSAVVGGDFKVEIETAAVEVAAP